MMLHGYARSGSRRYALRAMILATACIPGAAFAGDIRGTVISTALERPVRGAEITVEGTAYSVTTDENGRYFLSGLEGGTYSLLIEQPGYESQTIQVTVPTQGAVVADSRIALANGDTHGGIVVTGARASRLMAIERKRAMPVVADIVSSDGIGKLPDYNTAEALQRLPGISVEIDQSEPRYVVIRGVDPNLNQVMIDGNIVGIPEAEGRRVALDTIPSDLLGAIEVVKAVTPDYDANAIGGSINIITPSAFDRTGPVTFVSARGIYNDLSGKTGFGVSGMHGAVFGNDGQIGVVAGASYSKRYIDSQLVRPLSWQEVEPGVNAPGGLRMYDYSIMRERLGAILNLEWRPDADMRFYIRNIYNEFTDHEERDQFDYDMYRGDAVVTGDRITFDKGRASRQFRQNNQTQKLYNISPGAELRFGNIELDLNYTYAHAEEHTPVRDDLEFRSAGNKVSTILLDGDMPSLIDADESLYNPADYPLRRIRLRREAIDEDLHAAKADLQINFAEMGDSFLKLGVKYTDRVKNRENYQELWEPARASNFGQTGGALPAIKDYFRGRYDFGPAMDYAGVLDYYYNRNPDLLNFNEKQTAFNDKASDYRIHEKIYAGYAMANIDLGDLSLVGGVRVEHTKGVYDAFAIRDTDGDGSIDISDIAPLTFEKTYTNVLPGLALNYRPRSELAIRAAWTNTIGRPNYTDVVPVFEEEDGEGAAGNPELKPYKSMGLDLSVEYYPDADSVFSIAAFYKHIKNPIYTQTLRNTSFAGIDLLTLSQPQNAKDGELFGIEANAITRFSFLPAPFDGFGISANVTFVDSSVEAPGREQDDLPFFRQSRWIAGGALFYEKGPFEARFAVSYRDDYLIGIGSDSRGDTYMKDRTVLDARIGYRLLEGVEIFGSVSNINEAAMTEYQAIRSQTYGREIYGVNMDFGVSAKF